MAKNDYERYILRNAVNEMPQMGGTARLLPAVAIS